MQKPSVEQIVDFALNCLVDCKVEFGFEEIQATINTHIDQSSETFRRAEILLYMKYIAYYFDGSNSSLPKYLAEEARKPISLELINVIKMRIKSWPEALNEDNENPVEKKTSTAKDNVVEALKVKKTETIAIKKGVDPNIPKILFSKIEDCNFSVRLLNVLKKEEVNYVGQILMIDFLHFYRLPNVGHGTHQELLTFLKENRLSDLKIESWPNSNSIKDFSPQSIQLVSSSVQEKSGKDRINISDLTNEQLELVLCEIRFIPFSVRLKNALDTLGVTYFGEILTDNNQQHFAALKNVGKKTKLELEKYLFDHEISSILLK